MTGLMCLVESHKLAVSKFRSVPGPSIWRCARSLDRPLGKSEDRQLLSVLFFWGFLVVAACGMILCGLPNHCSRRLHTAGRKQRQTPGDPYSEYPTEFRLGVVSVLQNVELCCCD